MKKRYLNWGRLNEAAMTSESGLQLALLIVAAWAHMEDSAWSTLRYVMTDRANMTHPGFSQYFCDTRAEARAALKPITFALLYAVVGTFHQPHQLAKLGLPCVIYCWEGTRGQSRTPGVIQTHSRKLKYAMPGATIRHRGKDYTVVYEWGVDDRTAHPFKEVFLVPSHLVEKDGRFFEMLER